MDLQAETVGTDQREGKQTVNPRITAHESSPGRIVLTENGNTDGWMSSDLTVDLTRKR